MNIKQNKDWIKSQALYADNLALFASHIHTQILWGESSFFHAFGGVGSRRHIQITKTVDVCKKIRGITTLWHFLFHPESTTFICCRDINLIFTPNYHRSYWDDVLLEIKECLVMLKNSDLGWIVDYIQIGDRYISIKGFERTWGISCKILPENFASRLAGCFSENLLIWVDHSDMLSKDEQNIFLCSLTNQKHKCIFSSEPLLRIKQVFSLHVTDMNGN